jgi:hypothetical protein
MLKLNGLCNFFWPNIMKCTCLCQINLIHLFLQTVSFLFFLFGPLHSYFVQLFDHQFIGSGRYEVRSFTFGRFLFILEWRVVPTNDKGHNSRDKVWIWLFRHGRHRGAVKGLIKARILKIRRRRNVIVHLVASNVVRHVGLEHLLIVSE